MYLTEIWRHADQDCPRCHMVQLHAGSTAHTLLDNLLCMKAMLACLVDMVGDELAGSRIVTHEAYGGMGMSHYDKDGQMTALQGPASPTWIIHSRRQHLVEVCARGAHEA